MDAKLGDARASELLRLHLVEGMTPAKLASRFNVSRMTVYMVIDGRLYPHLSRHPDDYPDAGVDMTEEELDALIAEQLPTMPREPKQSGGPRLPLAVARGRGVQARERRRDR